MSHANARLTPAGRLVMVQRIQTGRAVAHVAAEMGISRTTAWRWWRRFRELGPAGMVDRSSCARSHPSRTSACIETRVRIMRHLTRRGPVFIAGKLGMHASTVGRVLHRHTVPLLRDIDPVTGTVIRAVRRSARRYEHDHPGSLIHIDVKKLGRIPDGGGWRSDPTQSPAVHRTSHHQVGYDYIHTVIDDHSRVAYAEIHDDEKGTTAAGVLERAIAFYATLGVNIERVISDNAFAYRHSTAFHAVIAAHGITQKFIKPHCPWTNGKVERLNRTLATEWAYAQPWTSNTDRASSLQPWLDHYNLDRAHLGIGGASPIDRINNGRGQYT
ncbi:IS481 family transposase [Demequina sp. TTPB684]|uniref:IS481 family transposase n=1 Tax=unclassified Demequina TaxID=2620311 RepID=UPI001CF32F4D|nr:MULTISPECIES: IS481 family transposase [unclassified Demequina]MCB2412212.1 IS481 family transposase [Demequina sp. TTPB684]UPU88002.1 IS481 family transposase [Demequina sp. TMPB413]